MTLRSLTLALALLLASFPARADWTIGGGAGPFVFGTFAERTSRIITGTGGGSTTSKLSASTRVGGSLDLEKSVNDWLGVKLEGSWTRSPLRIKGSGGTGVSFDAGEMSVTALALPAVIHLNRRGAFRFQLEAGPAYTLYRLEPRTGGNVPPFEGTRNRWGGEAGGSADWWLNSQLAIEARAVDLVTTSPFRREDLAAPSVGVKIPKTHNVHTTLGIRYRF